MCRARKEWQYRWGETFGVPERPDSSERSFKAFFEIPALPFDGVRRNTLVQPTTSAMKWDPATNRRSVPLRAVSERSFADGSQKSVNSLPPVRAVSISSSNERRRELLQERQAELKDQLEEIERLLKNAAPTSQSSIRSEDWRMPSVQSRPPTGNSCNAADRPSTSGSRASSSRQCTNGVSSDAPRSHTGSGNSAPPGSRPTGGSDRSNGSVTSGRGASSVHKLDTVDESPETHSDNPSSTKARSVEHRFRVKHSNYSAAGSAMALPGWKLSSSLAGKGK